MEHEIAIKRIGAENAADANIPNQPFCVWGRMIPALDKGVWTYTVEKFDTVTQMCFPEFP